MQHPAVHGPVVALVLACALAACTSTPSRALRASLAPAEPAVPREVTVVPERFIGPAQDGEELDSLATWFDEAGHPWLFASGKASHRIVVFDAATGIAVRTVGGPGTAPGQFRRPNGLAVFGDLLFVVERDNRRVQVLRLPDFAPAGVFGQPELRSPYGLWLHETAPDELEAYVTDSFMDGPAFDVVPPLAELSQRIRRYRLVLAPGGDALAAAESLGSFGDTTPAGALKIVESLAGDASRDRLLIADESRRSVSNLREYDLGGRWTGRSLPDGTFDGEAEGVLLWSCPGNAGYWLAVDQQAPLTSFHLFDRDTLAPRGSFRGEVTAMTDGVALAAASSAQFPQGALYAVHDDRAIAAFDLGDIVRALSLDPACVA